GPSQMPTLKGMPTGVFSGESGPPTCGAGCHPDESFWVEKPRMPEWANMLGSDAGKPKQSGSMYSALAMPNSRRYQLLPYRICLMIDSAFGEFTSPSSMDDPAGYQRPAATYAFSRSKSSGKYSFISR